MPKFAYFTVSGFGAACILQLANWKWPDNMPDVVFIPLMTAFLLLTIIPLALAGVRWWRERGIIIPTAEQTNSVSLRLDGALYDLDEESLLDARGTYDYTGKPILRARGRSRAKLEDTHRGKPGSSEPVPPSESGET